MATVHEITQNADAFRKAYPSWPSAEPAPPAPLAAVLPWCQSCGTLHTEPLTPCEPAGPCPDCEAGGFCHWWCSRYAEATYSSNGED